MRLGAYAAALEPGTLIHRIYTESGRVAADRKKIESYRKNPSLQFRLGILSEDDISVVERHRHRYEVNPAYIPLSWRRASVSAAATCGRTGPNSWNSSRSRTTRASSGPRRILSSPPVSRIRTRCLSSSSGQWRKRNKCPAGASGTACDGVRGPLRGRQKHPSGASSSEPSVREVSLRGGQERLTARAYIHCLYSMKRYLTRRSRT